MAEGLVAEIKHLLDEPARASAVMLRYTTKLDPDTPATSREEFDLLLGLWGGVRAAMIRLAGEVEKGS